MANSPAQKRSCNTVPIKKNRDAAKSLNNYLNQLKIHFDLNDADVIKVLDLILKERKSESFVKKWWHIFK